MKKTMGKTFKVMSASVFIGLMSGVEAHAGGGTSSGGNNFNEIVGNMEESISGIPGLITGVAYMMGIMLGVLGILKIKDHVENPGNAKLQDGAVRLAAGGALFALPIVYEAMQKTIGDDGTAVDVPQVKAIKFDVDG